MGGVSPPHHALLLLRLLANTSTRLRASGTARRFAVAVAHCVCVCELFFCDVIGGCLPYCPRAARRHDGKPNVVQVNDVMFSLHAVLLTAALAGQVLLYRTQASTVSKPVMVAAAVAWAVAVV